MDYDFEKQFDYENGYYLTAPVERFSKFATHMDLYRRISHLPGEVVECGVFKGASFSRLVKFRALFENPKSRRIIGFDTFGKFPDAEFEADVEVRQRFVSEAGDLSISIEDMRNCLDKVGLNTNIDLIAGDLRETLPAFLEENPALRISLLHIDVDLYEPTKACLENLFDHVVRGGIVILDDYGAFPGANKAIEEFLEKTKIIVEKLPYSNAISYLVKP